MYYSQARFSAHLDDGPTTPLVRWFQAIGRQAVLLIPEIEVFDLHDSQLVLWSPGKAEVEENAERKEMTPAKKGRVEYRAIDTQFLLHLGEVEHHNVGHVASLHRALREMGLDMRMRHYLFAREDGSEGSWFDMKFVITEAT